MLAAYGSLVLHLQFPKQDVFRFLTYLLPGGQHTLAFFAWGAAVSGADQDS